MTPRWCQHYLTLPYCIKIVIHSVFQDKKDNTSLGSHLLKYDMNIGIKQEWAEEEHTIDDIPGHAPYFRFSPTKMHLLSCCPAQLIQMQQSCAGFITVTIS